MYEAIHLGRQLYSIHKGSSQSNQSSGEKIKIGCFMNNATDMHSNYFIVTKHMPIKVLFHQDHPGVKA